MKNEGDLNRYLTKEIKKIAGIMMVKASDKYTPGISDFLLWMGGKGAFLETKFISKFPKTNRLLLKHPFSSRQVSFLRGMTNVAGCPAWGAIAVGEEKKLYSIPSWHIPSEGNWRAEEFLKLKSKLEEDLYNIVRPIKVYAFDKVEDMILELFREESKPIFRGPIIHVD